jgi:release factor glutamine methyltransferase
MLTIHSSPHVYGPEDDSYLLLEALSGEPLSGHGLEIGTGTGIIALHVSSRFKEFTAVDINPRAVTLAVHNAQINAIDTVRFLEGDLFSGVSGTFDVIICNPPYVPADEPVETVEELSYHGGVDGRQFIDRFLHTMPLFLTPRGVVYLLHSSLAGIDKTLEILEKNGFSWEIIGRKKLFFEELVVIKVSREEFHDKT